MNYKKLVSSLMVLMFLGMAAFADVAVKDLGKDGVAITFTYKDSSSEMGVIGSFDNWTVPGEAMTKNAAGLWEVTIKAAATDEITYKFYSKGTWIQDDNAPDHKDDGFGGKNGLIVVADILSGAVSATPGAAPVAVVVAKKTAPGRPKVAWGTQTYVQSDTAFHTDNNSVQNSSMTSYSNWKFNGDLIAGMPGHFEITAFKGQSRIYDNGAATGSTPLDIGTGTQNLVGGVLFSPFYYLGGNSRPNIDKFAFGVDSPYLVYNTGYANSPFPGHKSLLWDTVSTSDVAAYGSSTTTAGNGYSSFVLGPKAKDLGDVTIDAGLVPNMSLGSNFGLQSWFSATYSGVTAEVQYEMVAAPNPDGTKKTDASQFFTEPTQTNTILGVEGYFLDGFVARGEVLVASFRTGSTLDQLATSDKMASKLVVGYSDLYKDSELLFGYSYRSGYTDASIPTSPVVVPTAKLLYLNTADNDSILGAPFTQIFSAKGFQKFGYWGTAKLDSSATLATVDPSTSNVAVSFRPGFVVDFDKLNMGALAVEVYGQALVNTKPATGVDGTTWGIAGAKLSFGELMPGAIKHLDVYYKADNRLKNALNNTVLTEAQVGQDVTAQAGFGVRSGSATKKAVGFTLGAHYAIPTPEFKTPVIYTQFVYNMDPFDATTSAGGYDYALSDFGPKNGVLAYDGLGALRVGIEWNF